MSKGIDITLVQDYYRRLSDQEFIKIVTKELSGLTLEAIDVVKSEISRRNLNPNIANGVDAQHRDYTIEDIDSYCNLLQNLPNTKGDSVSERLNAIRVVEVASFILFTNRRESIVVGNSESMNAAVNLALLKCTLFGWWGIPWGPIQTIQGIRLNLKNKNLIGSVKPTKALREFVMQNIGEIVTYKNDPAKLKEIIGYPAKNGL